MTAYFLFMSEIRPQVSLRHPGVTQSEISKMIGEIWKGIQPEQKKLFEERAKTLREKYQVDVADYRLNTKALGSTEKLKPSQEEPLLPDISDLLPPLPPKYGQEASSTNQLQPEFPMMQNTMPAPPPRSSQRASTVQATSQYSMLQQMHLQQQHVLHLEQQRLVSSVLNPGANNKLVLAAAPPQHPQHSTESDSSEREESAEDQ